MQQNIANLKRDFAYAPLAAVLNLGEGEKKVWITLFTFQGQNDYCFPSLEAIRKRMGECMSTSRISRITTQLVKKGWLQKWRRGRRNQYRVLYPQDLLFVPDFGSLSSGKEKSKPSNSNREVRLNKESHATTTNKESIDKKKYKIPQAGRFGYDQLLKRPDEDDSYFLSKYGQEFVDYARSIGFSPFEYEEFLETQKISHFNEYLLKIGISQEKIEKAEEDYANARRTITDYQVA
jgi:hypothetical protein